MQEASRKQYLKAMGIDVWVRRVLPHDEGVLTESLQIDEPIAAIVPVEEPVEGKGVLKQNPPELIRWLNRQCLMPVRVGDVHATTIGKVDAGLLVLSECSVVDKLNHQPFSGQAAFLLQAMLRAIDESFETVLQAELDTPSNDTTTLTSVLQSKPIKAVLLLVDLPEGEDANSLQGFREETYHHDGADARIFISFHPDYLIAHPATKALAWEDLKQVRDYLANVSTR